MLIVQQKNKWCHVSLEESLLIRKKGGGTEHIYLRRRGEDGGVVYGWGHIH